MGYEGNMKKNMKKYLYEGNMKEICCSIRRPWDLEKFRAILRRGGEGLRGSKNTSLERGVRREKRHETCQKAQVDDLSYHFEKMYGATDLHSTK